MTALGGKAGRKAKNDDRKFFADPRRKGEQESGGGGATPGEASIRPKPKHAEGRDKTSCST